VLLVLGRGGGEAPSLNTSSVENEAFEFFFKV
jgi:hypothetical protein